MEKYYQFNNLNDETITVYLPKFEIDMETMKQIKHMSENNVLKNIRIMPDCHRGHGCVVGLTAQINDKVFPNYVGVDIGCGISIYPLKGLKLKRKKIPKIEKLIRAKIPMGFEKHKKLQMNDKDWNWLEEKCNEDLMKLKTKYPDFEYPEKIDIKWISDMMKRIGGDLVKDFTSMGTLGGGNHYVEINKDEDDNAYMTVHSGSRNIGYKICIYHQNIIDSNCRIDMIEYTKRIKKIRQKFKVSKIVKELEKNVRENMKSELHPKYLEGQELFDYLVDMIIGQNLASLNRIIMIRNVVTDILMDDFDPNQILETRHNYIDFNRFILRKGSISAEKGEKCIISLNMRDGVLLCEGKGNPEWNYSSAHGCGRVLNRTQASRLNMKTFKKEMEDVYSTCVRKETLDESPMAYRDPELVKDCLEGSVKILKQLKPIINCKGY